MKISPTKDAKPSNPDAILPLEEEKPRALKKGEYKEYKVRTNPPDNNSPVYAHAIAILTGSEDVRAADN